MRFLTSALAALVAVAAAAVPAHGESAPPPYSRFYLDKFSIDLMSREARVPGPAVSIGNLAYAAYFDTGSRTWRHNLAGGIQSSGSAYVVTLFGQSELFTLASGVFGQTEGQTSTLTYNSGANTYTLTLADGSVALFDKALAGSEPLQANEGRIVSFTRPNGETTSFTYVTLASGKQRLQSVTNNLGYQIKFEYAGNSDNADGQRVVKVSAINNAVDYCDPTANGCSSLTQSWPYVSFAVSGNVTTITDSIGLSSTLTVSINGSGNGTVSTLGPTGHTRSYTLAASKITNAEGTGLGASYYSTQVYDALTTQVNASNYTPYALLYRTATKEIFSAVEEEGRRVAIQLDATTKRASKRFDPVLGGETQYTRDARGNVTQTKSLPNPGSPLSNIFTYATFASTCSNVVTCNRPLTTTDERGGVTTYTYDSTHGGVTSVTAPEPSSGADQPQVRTSYSALYAWVKNASGNIVQAASPIYLPTEVSSCKSGEAPACVGTANETKTTVSYQAGSSSAASNLLPVSVTTAAGDASLSSTVTTTYNHLSEPLTVDGPLSGSADTIYSIYDAHGRQIGAVTPDPDGGGALKYRAAKTSFDATTGLVAKVETGTVDAPASFSSTFAALTKTQNAYDGEGRLIRQDLMLGSTVLAVKQFGYDERHLVCEAVRMNPPFSSVPSTCDFEAQKDSNDRLTRYTYAAGNQIATVETNGGQMAYYSYSSTGLLTLVSQNTVDRGIQHEYDGFNRLSKLIYGPHDYITTYEFEQFAYDAAGNVTSVTLRDGAVISTAYDALNRPTSVNAPGTANDTTTTYDNDGRALTVATAAQTITSVYDALGRTTSVTGPLGAVAYQYDAAGQRTRMTWPDSFYVTYDYDAAGAVTAIRENGATSGAGVLATFAYDDLGRRVSLTRGNGVTTAYAFDDASRLASIASDMAGSGDDLTKSFVYNGAGQIATASLSNSAYLPAPAVGRADYVVNELNQPSYPWPQSVTETISYDVRGNLIDDSVRDFTYDELDRLTDAAGVALVYDPIDRLYQTTSTASVVTKFLYDGADLIGEFNSSNAMLRRYVHGPGDDEPLVWYEGSGTSDRRWLIADDLGSVIAVTNASGAVTTKNSYDEYGAPASANVGRFQYTGQIYLPETGLYHYKARAYHPQLGRFLQTDPLGYADGLNVYAYVRNDPVNGRDPSGMAGEPTEALASASILGGPPETEADVRISVPRCALNPWDEGCPAAREAAISDELDRLKSDFERFSGQVKTGAEAVVELHKMAWDWASQCRSGYATLSFGGGFTAASMGGVGASLQATYSIPNDWTNIGQYQMGYTVQGQYMAGIGFLVSAGLQGSIGSAKSSSGVISTSSGSYQEVDFYAGDEGFTVSSQSSGDGTSSSYGVGGGRIGPGLGVYGGSGKYGSASLLTPTFSKVRC